MMPPPFDSTSSDCDDGRLVAPEAERSVLAAMFRDPSCIPKVTELLRREHFHTKAHGMIFATAAALGDRLDISTLTAQLRAEGVLAAVGGVDELVAILQATPHAAHVAEDAGLVLDAATRRAAAQAADELSRAARSGSPADLDVATAAAGSVTSVTEIVSGGTADWTPPIPLPGTGALLPFPTQVLPAWARHWVEAEAEAIQTPVDLPALLVLGVISAVIAKKITIWITPGWHEPTNLYIAIALPSGEGKTPVFRHATLPLVMFEREEAKRLEPVIRDAAERVAALCERKKQLRKQSAKAEDPAEREQIAAELADVSSQIAQIKVPVPPRFVADDATMEALAMLLLAHGGRMAVFSAEGGPFEIMAGRYSEGVAFELYLKGHSGDYLAVDRITRRGGVLYEPILTVVLTVQPSVIAGLAEKEGFRGRGLIARFGYSIPKSRVGFRPSNRPWVPRDVAEGYAAAIRSLLRLPTNLNGHGEIAGHGLEVAEDARDVFFAFKDEIEPQMAPGADLDAMADWVNKLPGLVLRLAAILHMAQHADAISQAIARPVGSETLSRAVEIGRYFLAHAKAALGLMSAPPLVEDAKLVLAFVQRKGFRTVKRRDLQRGMNSRFRKVQDLDPVIEILIRHGFLRELPPRVGPKGGHPEQRFAVNPISPEEPIHVTVVTEPTPAGGCVTSVTPPTSSENDEERLEREPIQEEDWPADQDAPSADTGDEP